ncbi:hypothetical protein SARC_01683 [Sphaeroforma arctica JP610]|uniref:Uncharacterized protein n=1 Tax=Sphaeroforma arctica JP610 TaxID=667725 RepID=A0A0L0GAX4_9EUKA|nr:hypothetical protein SARC_01683 [Sphaeroforma arctica JP610]KNC86157.1 hypothetical protein SARC_01683 [Sphaeroforma arctica JP610]|eukprot:XP_014160059.1 hypothetical protein SARC_01683 [Sphaeroforma arctica JP610]
MRRPRKTSRTTSKIFNDKIITDDTGQFTSQNKIADGKDKNYDPSLTSDSSTPDGEEHKTPKSSRYLDKAIKRLR